MPRWTERRGFTLRVSDPSHEKARAQVVRLSLVERRGLAGTWFNVREARAEPAGDDTNRPLAGGRALSWRWMRPVEAEHMLDQRLRTLKALGYEVVDAQMIERGRWDWLYELVRRGLRPPEQSDDSEVPGRALRDALSHLGLSPDAVIEGVATVLELPPHGLRNPDGKTVARVDPEDLGVLLPFLVEHEHAEIQAVGERWLAVPGAAFQLPRPLVERWLTEAGPLGDRLATRVRRDGLALLGPDALLRLSKGSSRPPVRRDAAQWTARLS